ncbi:HipA domain-containing protein [Bradyrhizobium sp. CCGUVB1N3]|uniref:type II toxin-antitoxin system HipA family toxin n=1 Tax=Bradyrhizobium sp. CCGUVB1N3 TaxID=2949629 RepID=UPI0020B22AF7|nr:HipA domain-containing protein [Bradyrhizobium sp. CCGUVB1N3]MCP3476081.1 HipA domain-containing protein [Bradyrhizobium sp. CCGUVB1N3]
MELRTAEILFKDEVAGTLTETANGGTRFVYGTDWNTPIACCLPSTQREHEWANGMHPFFQQLGPEGWLRERQARGAHLAEEDDFGLLLRYGADCIGAVGIKSSGDTTNLPSVAEATNPGRTISGVQKKLLVVKDGNDFRPADPTGLAPYIAKFNSQDLPTLVRNEALSLRWTAAVLGADEANTHTIGQVSNETALIVTRFDRTPDGKKLRLEDFAQILRKPRGQDQAGKYDASYEDVAVVIKAHSVRPEIDLDKLFRRLVVFALIGNCDGHLKNFSLLETPTGLRLAPLYDVVNTAHYERYNQNLALRIDGKEVALDSVTRPLLESFGPRIGLPQRAIDQAFKDLKAKVQRASSIITPPPAEPPDGFVHRYAEIVSRACLRILGE